MAVEVREAGDLRLTIDYDTDPLNPREWDNLTEMLCFHNKYRLGDTWLDYKESEFGSWQEVYDRLVADGHTHIRGLYLYDHSGITIWAGKGEWSPADSLRGWDSGQVGFVYIPAGSYYLDPTKFDVIVQDEVTEYDNYLTGQVYYYKLEKRNHCDHCGHTEWEFVDSCGGFYSVEDAVESAGWSEVAV